jgi:tetratricopeptide (TPR) repeat protein
LGERVRLLRRERGLSQAELAGSELSESYISLIESGRRVPSRRALGVIAAGLSVSVEGLVEDVVVEDPSVSFAVTFAELAARSGDVGSARSVLAAVGADRVGGVWGARLGVVSAMVAELEGDLEGACSLLESLLGDVHVQGALWAEVATALVRCYRELGDLSRAVLVGEEATARLVAAGLSGTPEHVGVGLTMASALHERGEVARAASVVAGLVAEAERVGSREARGSAYWNAALIAQGQGRQRDAVRLAEKALALVSEGDDARRVARLTAAQAWILLGLDEPRTEDALGLLAKAYGQLVECGSATDRALVATELGRAHLLAGHVAEATGWARQALELLGDAPRLETAKAWMVLAQAQAADGDSDGAKTTARLAASLLDTMGATRQAAQIWRDVADLLTQEGDTTGACTAYDRALASMGVTHTTDTPIQTPAKAVSVPSAARSTSTAKVGAQR